MSAGDPPPTPPARPASRTTGRVRFLLLLVAAALVAVLLRPDEEPPAPPTVAPPDPACGPGPRADGALVGFSPGASFFGDPQEMADDLAAMAESGATWVRLDLDWSWAERTRGAPDWDATDTAVGLARDAGLRVLLLVAYTPSWARPEGTDDKTPPTDPSDLAAFARRAAVRYGDTVDAWEVWNEPNLDAFWRPRPDPAAYARLLVETTEAIRTVDPDAFVLSGGLAPATDTVDGAEWEPERFLAAVAAAGGLDAVDAVGMHPYSFPSLPDGGEPWNLFGRLPALAELAVDREGRAMPLWLTEYGFPTGDHPESVTEELQAQGIVEAIVAAQSMPGIGPLFVYADRDRDEEADPGGFGVRAVDGAPKPAWLAIREAVRCR
jgi:hypothetical protein